MTRTAEDLRRRVAELEVLEAYDFGRSDGYLDTGGGRRRRSVAAVRRDLLTDLRAAGITGLPAPDAELLADAFLAEARRRINRNDAGPSVRNALRRAATALDREHDLGEACLMRLTMLGVAEALEPVGRRGNRRLEVPA